MRTLIIIIILYAIPPDLYLSYVEFKCSSHESIAGITHFHKTVQPDHNDSQGTLSPDGKSMVFVSDRDGNDDLFLINLDGSGLQQLTSHEDKDFLPHWSPDGKQIVFTSGRDGNLEIYKINIDGSGLQRLTDNPQIDEAPKWSPDATKIAFFSLREDGNPDLYIMYADGSGLERITDDEGVETFPNWSPYGKDLSFTKIQLPERNPAMFMVHLDSKKWTEIYDSPGKDFGTSWVSSDRLAFYSDRTGNFEIYLVNKDGSELVQLTDNPATDTFPAYGPDDYSIIFTSDRSGSERIYRMNVENKSIEIIPTAE